MRPVDAAAVGCYTRHEHDAAPVVLDHVRDGELAEEERGTEVDGQRVIPFFEGDVDDVGNADAMAGVGDEDVWSRLAVVRGEFFEQARDVGGVGHVDLVGRDAELW